jgi:hypothetical protein
MAVALLLKLPDQSEEAVVTTIMRVLFAYSTLLVMHKYAFRYSSKKIVSQRMATANNARH